MNKLKNNKKIKITTIIIIYLLIIACLILSITIARYQTSITNETTQINTAKWVFKLSYNNTQITNTDYNIDLKDTITTTSTNIAADYIAPGTAGAIDLKIDCTDCEVGVKYILKITDPNATLPSQLKFYTNSDFSSSSEINLNTEYLNYIGIADVNTIQDKTIYWKWIATDENTINNEDLNKSGKTMEINIKITGEQMITNNN